MVTNDDAPAERVHAHRRPGVAVVVEKAVGTKCARSWKILPTVGEDAEYPDVSPRDAQALREWKALAEGDKPVDAVEAPAEPVGLIETQHANKSSHQAKRLSKPVREAWRLPSLTGRSGPGRLWKARRLRKPRDRSRPTGSQRPRRLSKPRRPLKPKPRSPAAKKAKAKKAKAKPRPRKPKKAVAKKAVAKKAKAKKAAKSKKASSATKGAKKAAAKKAATKTAAKKAKKKAAKKAGKKAAGGQGQKRRKRRPDKCLASNTREPLTSAPASSPRSSRWCSIRPRSSGCSTCSTSPIAARSGSRRSSTWCWPGMSGSASAGSRPTTSSPRSR